MSNVLVVAAHPDDEVLGIGGIILKHKKRGDRIRSIIMCEGESLRYAKDVGQSEAINEVAKILGVEQVYLPKLKDQKLDSYNLTDVIGILEKISEENSKNNSIFF